MEPESDDLQDEDPDNVVSRSGPKGRGKGIGKRSKPAREFPPKKTEEEAQAAEENQ